MDQTENVYKKCLVKAASALDKLIWYKTACYSTRTDHCVIFVIADPQSANLDYFWYLHKKVFNTSAETLTCGFISVLFVPWFSVFSHVIVYCRPLQKKSRHNSERIWSTQKRLMSDKRIENCHVQEIERGLQQPKTQGNILCVHSIINLWIDMLF